MKLVSYYSILSDKFKKKKKKKKVETIVNTGSWFANIRFSLDALIFHLLYKRYTIAKQSLSNR